MRRFLPPLPLISQSDWLICRCDKSPDNAARVNVSCNAFFSSRSEKRNIFLDIDIVVKKQIKCGLALSAVILPTTSTTFRPLPLMTRTSVLSIRVQTTINHMRFVNLYTQYVLVVRLKKITTFAIWCLGSMIFINK